MGLTRSAVEAMAPDQGALTAASALLKPAKWPVRARSGGLIWGECQGSGANPYRVVADTDEHGSKCTCPSRKFPCKHAIALMWMFVEDGGTFKDADIPAWVNDWMGRRRKATTAGASTASGEAKSLSAAREAVAEAPPDPKAEARKQAAALKRAQDTGRSVRTGTEDLDGWITDQLRTGLPAFLNEVGERCRRIAARLVDAKAGALASRIDEMPSRLLDLPTEERIDGAVAELGKLAMLTRAWRAAPDDPGLRREVIGAETREEVLANADAPRVASQLVARGEIAKMAGYAGACHRARIRATRWAPTRPGWAITGVVKSRTPGTAILVKEPRPQLRWLATRLRPSWWIWARAGSSRRPRCWQGDRAPTSASVTLPPDRSRGAPQARRRRHRW